MGLRQLVKRAMCIMTLVACICSFASAASAIVSPQRPGTLTGKVFGLSGEEIFKAPIEAKNIDSGQTFNTASVASGVYSLAELPAGKYEVSSPVFGFERKEVEVRPGETTKADLRYIELGNVLGTIGDGDLGTLLALYNRPAPPVGPTPRTPDGKPDLSGYWLRVSFDPPQPDMQPWAAALTKYRVDTEKKYLPSSRCLITGIAPVDHMLIHTPRYLVVLTASAQSHRLIFLDGREHPKDPDPAWLGHAIGKWEGDTLLVDRIGFNEGSWYDPSGIPHTNMLHLVERYRRSDLGHMEIETTIEDPGAYVRPWARKVLFELKPNQEVAEYLCSENNVEASSPPGK